MEEAYLVLSVASMCLCVC